VGTEPREDPSARHAAGAGRATTEVTLAYAARQLSRTPVPLATPEAKRLHRLKTVLRYWGGGVKHLQIRFEGYANLSVSTDNRSCKALEKKRQSGKFSHVQVIVIK